MVIGRRPPGIALMKVLPTPAHIGRRPSPAGWLWNMLFLRGGAL
jgi:hypothetical protein